MLPGLKRIDTVHDRGRKTTSTTAYRQSIRQNAGGVSDRSLRHGQRRLEGPNASRRMDPSSESAHYQRHESIPFPEHGNDIEPEPMKLTGT